MEVLELEDDRVPVELPLGDLDELTDAVPVGETDPVLDDVVVAELLGLEVGDREDVVEDVSVRL